ncbi:MULTISPECIES: ABC transporter substrate-binding protein [Aneurinibacillus]|uniref:ABC transporter substrate-binding protein n=1 Tax=Aneurinibacillus thermoaerophilus TaxID=143495 RepID=A0A1G8AR34_ANETH|nr:MULTISPECIES: ABC transporter substrate-binding protein [Aneurinibacillus]AMA74221.1 ethanolamine utilization protein EutJ [Aneurinibacillus sp. XH2]MED0676785.1 ABC transporter substrate-binding protein [Aneurinibacillus thermoaerophilus]MED0680997.1 ABC transporter substrate-binding protein [Aneurinibacillus thermoaerophilus]MED0738588.1 ABC transporter substrate-binding protein [Aneurinibacillus thermoaerophilus]MED0758990.1 ABC transporter substrate-binding protein [Aneurinibacillus the
MKKRKVTGILLSLMLSAGIAVGCSGGTKDANTSASGGQGAAGDTIKIGANLELSGGTASYGQSSGQGIELAVEEINKNGGINGKKLEVVKVDNKSDPAESTNAAIKLISQEKVAAIIGPATSGAVLAEVEVATKNKTPVITTAGTSTKITVNDDGSVNDFMFRTCFIDPFQGKVAANFATKELKVKTAAIFSDSSSDYAKGLADAFEKKFTENGGKVVAKEAYVAKDTDFRATLTRIKSANPEFIFIPGYYEEVGLIVKQARELGIKAVLMGGDGWDSPTLVELAGKDALNNAYTIVHYSSDDPDPKIQNFVKAFKEKYNGKSPNGFNALGYDSVYFLADALKRAGDLDPIKIKDALAQTKDLQLVSGKFSVDEQHNPIKSATILEYKDGKQVFKTKINP